MEDNNKYYTPSIEEFYIGFECECVGVINNNTIYNKTKILNEDTLYKSLKGTCRVKYLDKDDIEELGWKFFGMPMIENGHIVYRICYPKEEMRALVSKYVLSHTPHINHLKILNENGLLFIGTIKNKSELKRLMEQLNIN